METTGKREIEREREREREMKLLAQVGAILAPPPMLLSIMVESMLLQLGIGVTPCSGTTYSCNDIICAKSVNMG